MPYRVVYRIAGRSKADRLQALATATNQTTSYQRPHKALATDTNYPRATAFQHAREAELPPYMEVISATPAADS